MNSSRRKMLRSAGGASLVLFATAAGLVKPGTARAWNQRAFDTHTLADAVKAMGGTSAPTESRDIVLTSPDIAENGAVVPFTIASKVPNTQSIALLIEKNPGIVAASFAIPQATDPWVNTRVKMQQTSNVHALVKGGDGKFYYASKEVKVTLGGCGG